MTGFCYYCDAGFPLSGDGRKHLPTQRLGMIPVVACERAKLKKPTRKDLIALLTFAAHHAGSAKNEHDDDRDPQGFEKAQKRLVMLQERLIEAAGMLPYIEDGESLWTHQSEKPV